MLVKTNRFNPRFFKKSFIFSKKSWIKSNLFLPVFAFNCLHKLLLISLEKARPVIRFISILCHIGYEICQIGSTLYYGCFYLLPNIKGICFFMIVLARIAQQGYQSVYSC